MIPAFAAPIELPNLQSAGAEPGTNILEPVSACPG